jgi:uncharacterized protein YcsI (UPF0317 family)
MATKKKASSRKPRSTRISPVQAKTKAAAEALSNVWTIIHVHGIGNKPPAEVLQYQWEEAMIGFDLGCGFRRRVARPFVEDEVAQLSRLPADSTLQYFRSLRVACRAS